MSGLAAGIRLAMFDKRVVILERHYVWGGLNSFYQFKGRQFDVGLHAMTNYVKRGSKGKPLTRLLKQLRLRHEQLDLHEQSFSLISFPSAKMRFDNDFETLRGEVRRAFPREIDGFDALTREIVAFNELDLDAPQTSAREVVRCHIREPLLEDMLFCPLMFYGSAREHDMDWDQFVVMWKSIYMEGFARPQQGVRHVLSLLTNRYRELGGELRLRAGVKRILTRENEAVGVELDSGEIIEADNVLSSAGLVETQRLCSAGFQPAVAPASMPACGKLSFTESISVLNSAAGDGGDTAARMAALQPTIIFFSNRDRFEYRCPDELCDVDSGVICMPQNFKLPKAIEPLVRITNIANYAKWAALPRSGDSDVAVPEAWGASRFEVRASRFDKAAVTNPETRISNLDYRGAKQAFYERSVNAVTPAHLPDFRASVQLVDMFTPRTITHYTGHEGGAVYGSPKKSRTGETSIKGLTLMGTDQGFLGIIGAALSGISMANRWVLKESAVSEPIA
ncbi:MAG: NAD(P)/FAD-dependent oxidoreductase [Planctomycetes bacterium]|nr:NAD(P)/FAD-dependent oxidoreductase [Planctomycetota bacterium]